MPKSIEQKIVEEVTNLGNYDSALTEKAQTDEFRELVTGILNTAATIAAGIVSDTTIETFVQYAKDAESPILSCFAELGTLVASGTVDEMVVIIKQSQGLSVASTCDSDLTRQLGMIAAGELFARNQFLNRMTPVKVSNKPKYPAIFVNGRELITDKGLPLLMIISHMDPNASVEILDAQIRAGLWTVTGNVVTNPEFIVEPGNSISFRS